MDPQAQLAMLETIQDATEAEAWMPPTPLWHAPLLSTSIAGLALFRDGPAGWAIAGGVVGGVAVVFAAWDQLRRRRATPRRMAKPLRPLAFYGIILAVTFVIVATWGMIDVPDRSGPAVLALIGAWLATTVAFAVGIATTNRMRNRWAASQR